MKDDKKKLDEEQNDEDVMDQPSVANIVQFAQDSNPSMLKQEVGAVLGGKIMDRIESSRKDIASAMFSGNESLDESEYEKKMINILMKLINATSGAKKGSGKDIYKMAVGIKGDVSVGNGISPKQAEWVANTWKAFKG